MRDNRHRNTGTDIKITGKNIGKQKEKHWIGEEKAFLCRKYHKRFATLQKKQYLCTLILARAALYAGKNRGNRPFYDSENWGKDKETPLNKPPHTRKQAQKPVNKPRTQRHPEPQETTTKRKNIKTQKQYGNITKNP